MCVAGKGKRGLVCSAAVSVADEVHTVEQPTKHPTKHAPQIRNPKQNLSTTPPATSCRAGAIVHLLRANGIKVPVTVDITQHDNGERVSHVVRIEPSSESARLDSQRLVLGVGESGSVVAVNPGAAKSLFGFQPQSLVGCRLSAFVSVFRECQKQSGDDTGLLTALGLRALEGATDETWRVGVTLPNAASSAAGAATAASGYALSTALQQRNRERPALMSVAVCIEDEEAEGSKGAVGSGTNTESAAAGGAQEKAVLEVVLWRADAVAGVVEVDRELKITRADAAAGLLFGVNHRALLKKDFRK